MKAKARLAFIAAFAAAMLLVPSQALALTAASDEASAITDTDALMQGRVNPEGLAVTSCRFEYGTTTAYGATMPCTPKASELGTGNTEVAVSAKTEAVEPGTPYHYRLVTTNGSGTVAGVDRTFTTTGTPPCPNADIRVAQGIVAILLPECMALEMVSPPKKFNQHALEPSGISVNGDRVTFNSFAALGETPTLLDPLSNVYVATRGPDGWETSSASPPDTSIAVSAPPVAQSFTPDFSRWFNVALTTDEQLPLGIAQSFHGGLGGLYAPLSPPLIPAALGGENPEVFVKGTRFLGASADHSHLYLRPSTEAPSASYIPGDPAPVGSANYNTYVAHLDNDGDPSLELLARDADGKVWGGNCGARLGGIEGGNGGRNQGAVSADGTRVYFSTRPSQPALPAACSTANKQRILQRIETSSGPWIKELVSSECKRIAPACKTEAELNGDDFYQGASVDGTKVYFTSTRQLTDSDLDSVAPTTSCAVALATTTSCDLYLYDTTKPLGQRLTQVSEGEVTPGTGANVLNGITGISGDGSRVYFVAKGVLTNADNPEGKSADEYLATDPKLYTWDAESEETAFIGTAVSADSAAGAFLWGGNVGAGLQGTLRLRAYPVPVTGKDGDGAEVGGDGHVLLFQSKATMTSDDTDASFRDVFRYDAESDPPTLIRVSKAVPGGQESGADANTFPRSGPLGTDFAENNRWVSEDGETVLFLTNEGLVPGDEDSDRDSYLWKEGSLSRPPDGPADLSQQLSRDGSMVAFETTSQLLPQDGDTVKDVYAVRAGGGFPVVESTSCPPDAGDGCQGPAADPPLSGQPASSSFSGTGNVKAKEQTKGRRCPKGKRVVRRGGKARCVKRQVQRKTKAHRQQRAGREQGGRK